MRISAFCTSATTVLAVTFLAACGGGGGSNGGPTTPVVTTPPAPTTLAASAGLSGVAASGSPLLASSIKVVDGAGVALSFVDSSGKSISGTTTSLTDGSYHLTLGATAARLPLFIEAQGRDASGMPVILHSLVYSATVPAVANVTPASEAIAALVLGADPASVFRNAASSGSSIALLGSSSSVSAASDQLKAIIAANLSDSKTSAKTLDFLQDSTFKANKSGLDAALEGLRIEIVKDANGKDQLQISNKLLSAGSVEVKIDLATALSELAKTTGGSLSKAIVSTTKTSSSATTTLANLASLDELGIATNQLLAKGAATNFSALFPAYGVSNSYTSATLAAKLAVYASKGYQLNAFQVGACADDPIGSKGCTHLLVSAVVTSNSGAIVDLFTEAVAYDKATTPNWTFVGNGLLSDFHVYPTAYVNYGLDGKLAATTTTTTLQNPGSGIQVAIASPASDPQRNNDRMILMPSGHVIRFTKCGLDYQCLTAAATTTLVGTGELKDSLLQAATFGWMGSSDTSAGANYQLSFATPLTTTDVSVKVHLAADMPTDLGAAPFPQLDDVSTGTPLTPAAIAAGPTLSWANWAAAHADMKIVLARRIISSAKAAPLVLDAVIPATAASSVKLAAAVLPTGFVASNHQLWLGAQDNLGRRYYSRYSSAP